MAWRGYAPASDQATALASVIVAFPRFLFLTRWWSQKATADPERRDSLVRGWLTCITLAVAAGSLLGDMIALLANVLAGDPTVPSTLKAATILVVKGCIFGYYLWDMRQVAEAATSFQNTWVVRGFLRAVVITVVGCIAHALFLIGHPANRGTSGRCGPRPV